MLKFLKSLIKQYAIAMVFLIIGTVMGATLSFQVTKGVIIMGNDMCIAELQRAYGYKRPDN